MWPDLEDEMRQFVLNLQRPTWAKAPGKLRSQRARPRKHVTMISEKIVRYEHGRYYDVSEDDEYVVGETLKQKARPGHRSGSSSYPDLPPDLPQLMHLYRRGLLFSKPCYQQLHSPVAVVI